MRLPWSTHVALSLPSRNALHCAPCSGGGRVMAEKCIFCKIVAGEIPCVRVYQDADVLAFMDIGPVVKGHTLVIPKAHYDPITGTPVEVLQRLIAVVQRVAQAQYAGLN